MAEKMSPEELQRLSTKIATEVLQRVTQTMAGDLEGGIGTSAARQFVFKCPGDFECTKTFKCTQSFTAVALPE